MAQKVRLVLEVAQPGFIRRCVSCRDRVEPNDQFYRDLDSDDDLCVKCADWFIDRKYAIKVQA